MSDNTIPNEITPNDATIDNLFVSGNVGIGIEAPGPATARLELKSQESGIGTIKLFPNSGAGRDFSYDGGTDNVFVFSHYGQENGRTEFIWDNGASPTRLLTIKNTGHIGIGIADPSLIKAQLHVEGKVIYSGGSLGGISFGNRGTSGFVELPTNGERWTWYSSEGTARLWSGGDKLSVNANGNVGIGTINPEAKLHLNSARGNIKMLRTSGLGDDFSYDGGPDSFFAFTHYGKDTGETGFIWNDGTSKRDLLTIKNKGNVGIGTTNPQSMLHIGDGLGSGYRSWMVRGTQVSGETDNVFFGLKREGGDRQDAVIAWGDNTDDVFRFIFVGIGGPADGHQEIMKLQANGDVRVTGDVYARNQILSSSRELKENIAELSGKEAVEAIKKPQPG